MQISTLNTPQSIYQTTVAHFPLACLEAHVHHTNEVAIKILLGSGIPVILLKGAVFKEVFEMKLLNIKVLQAFNMPFPSSISDCDCFLTQQPITEWQQFNRVAYEKKGGNYLDLIADYLNNPTESAEQKLLDLGLAPSQVCKEGYLLPEADLNYFRHTLDKDLKFCVNMEAKYPSVLEQIRDKALDEDLRHRIPSNYDKILEILRARVLGQEMATSVVASALSSQQSGLDENHTFLFVGLTGTGKTELAKTIATTKKKFISFNMNQYVGAHDSSRFFGSPTGFLGSSSKSDLAQELDQCNPTSGKSLNGKKIFIVENVVLLFDELEKAHLKTRQSFLTLFDEGIADISYTEEEQNVKIQYQLKNSVIVVTSNLFQQEICNAFRRNMNSEQIAEGFTQLNVTMPSENNYSPEFLGRLTITPFGPIPRGVLYQNILKLKIDIFLKEYKAEMKCHAVCIKEGNEKLFYQGLEDLLHGDTSDIRKVKKFFKRIKCVVNQNINSYGNITNKKLTLFCENGQILIKLEMFSYGKYQELSLPPILIEERK